MPELNRELKPCPFCGQEAHLDRYDIFCDCGAKIDIPQYVGGKVSIAGYPTYEEAVQEMIEAWNNRAEDVVPRSEVEELKKRLELTEIAYAGMKQLYEKAEQDVAREIFEELKKAGIDKYRYPIIAELEKKYIGE